MRHRIKPVKVIADWANGWLSPRGSFYACMPETHFSLARRLGAKEEALERRGWMKLQGNNWWHARCHRDCPGTMFFNTRLVLTQSQIDALFDWHKLRKRKMELWMVGD